MEISNKVISLKHYLGMTEISNSAERTGLGSQGTPFVEPSIITNPNPDSLERSKKEKIAPITPNKTEGQFANKKRETGEGKILNDGQKQVKNIVEESTYAIMSYKNSNELKIDGASTPDPKSEKSGYNKGIIFTRRKKRRLHFEDPVESETALIKAIMSFIERTKVTQGDREYSEWPVSVLDSVVGGFLAQNTRDDFSSASFMSLARCFPPRANEDKSSLGRIAKVKVNTDCYPKGMKKINKKYKEVCEKIKKMGYHLGTEDIDWDEFRWRSYKEDKVTKEDEEEESKKKADLVDWEAVRTSSVNTIGAAIHDRGMHSVLAERIRNCLDRIKRDHGRLDLEWLREVSDEEAKAFLLSIYGLGVKSVECICLLALNQVAFPVDTNVRRICLRLGWVRPEELKSTGRDSVHENLLPRLCSLGQKTLYQLHCQMITFGKTFCTELTPNCNNCPLRNECKYISSSSAENIPDMEDLFSPVSKKLRESPNYDHRALVVPELYNQGKHRSMHYVIELPQSHRILITHKFEERNPDDPFNYLLLIWGDSDKENACKSGMLVSKHVKVSILIPVRTAMRGKFPLNGTFFQYNEVYADRQSVKHPIKVSRKEISALRRFPCFFGTSISTIFKGVPQQAVQLCFSGGFVCVKDFDRETRTATPWKPSLKQ